MKKKPRTTQTPTEPASWTAKNFNWLKRKQNDSQKEKITNPSYEGWTIHRSNS